MRGALTLGAAALLALGAAGCTTGADLAEPSAAPGSEAPTEERTEETTPAEQESESTGSASNDGGDAAEEGAPAAHPPAVLYITDGVPDAVDRSDLPWKLNGSAVETVLADHDIISDRTAPSCLGVLTYTDGASITCTASIALEGLQGQQELTVMAVRAPAGFDTAGAPALLVTIGNPPSPEALAAFTDQDHHLVGVGQGSMFGTAELSATELIEMVESTANSDNGFALLDAPVTGVSCEGPLPAASTEPVECEVAWEHDPSVTMGAEAMGVWFVDADPGLLVALEIGDQDTPDEER